MPTVTRSNISMIKKRTCIEVETPLIPKDINRTLHQNKKRKLAKEFSPACNNDQKENKNGNVAQKRLSTRNKSKNDTARKTRQNVKRQHNLKNTSQSPNTQRRHTNSIKVSYETEDLSSSKDNDISSENHNDLTDNFHQKRVSDAIETICNGSGQEHSVHEMSLPKSSQVSSKQKKQDKVIADDELNFLAQEQANQEEDYQQKYFQLLQMMKNLQEELLTSQQRYENHVMANDELLEQMKNVLEDKNNELLCTSKELELCRAENFKLENCKRQHELDVKELNSQVEELKEAVTSDTLANDREKVLMQQISDQKDVLDCYKTLTGISMEKHSLSSDDNGDILPIFQSFLCLVTPTDDAKEEKFILTRDREFAEIEYKPLCSDETKDVPAYLREQIFFDDVQASKFLVRLLRHVHNEK